MATLVGSFAKPTGTGGETHNITGLTNNAQPKFIQFWSCGQTSSGSFSSTDNIKTSIGFTNGSTHQSVGIYCQDNVSPANTYRSHRATPLFGITADGTIEWEITSITFNAGGAQLTFGTNNSTAVLINYEIIYGQNLTNVDIGFISLPSTTGSFSFATGLSYVPSCVRFISAGIAGSSLPQGTDHAVLAWGCAISSSATIAGTMRSRDNPGASSSTMRLIANDACIAISDATSQARAYNVGFTSFNTVGSGVTLNATTVSGANPGAIVSYALFGGGSYSTSTLSTSSPDVTGLAYQPDGVLLVSAGIGTVNTTAQQASFSIGAADGTTQRCISIFEHHAQNPSVVISQQNNTLTNILTPNTPVADSTITFNSFTASGFDLTASITTRTFGYLSYNTGAAPDPGTESSASSYYYRSLMS